MTMWQRVTVDVVFHDTTCARCGTKVAAGDRMALVQVKPPGHLTEPWCIGCLGIEATGRFELLLGPKDRCNG